MFCFRWDATTAVFCSSEIHSHIWLLLNIEHLRRGGALVFPQFLYSSSQCSAVVTYFLSSLTHFLHFHSDLPLSSAGGASLNQASCITCCLWALFSLKLTHTHTHRLLSRMESVTNCLSSVCGWRRQRLHVLGRELLCSHSLWRAISMCQALGWNNMVLIEEKESALV